ncbi:MAG: helix-turn-helix domain-containing protein [Nocardioides sp.]|jgi:excisionase family DNA binding protein
MSNINQVASRSELRPWLSQAEAADYIGVTDRTIRNYIARGLLPARRVRGSRLIKIDRADLDNMLTPIPSAKVG